MKKPLVLTLLSALLFAGSIRAADLDPATMSEAEWQEYRFERLTVVRTNPDLAAESERLKAEAHKQALAVEAAMAKADPAVASLLIKLAALLKGNWYAPNPDDSLSIADWQAIRAARTAALQANPDLVAANKALKEQTRAFDAKVDAALIKADPGLAGLVGRMADDKAN